MNGNLNLKIFLSISLGFHLLLISILTLLYPNFKISHFPPLNIEVSLYPILSKTKAATHPTTNPKARATDRELPLNVKTQDLGPVARISVQEDKESLQKEKKEEPAFKKERDPESPSIQTEVKVDTPANDPQSAPPDKRMREVTNRFEEKKEKEPIIHGMNISLQSDSTLTLEKGNSSIDLHQPKVSHRNPLPKTGSFDGQKNIARFPSNSEGDIPPKVVKVVDPIYPQWAKDRNYQGEVILRVQLLSNGGVGEIKIKKSSGHEILDHSAITAVKQWEFIPGREGNTPIWYWVNIPIKFQLQ